MSFTMAWAASGPVAGVSPASWAAGSVDVSSGVVTQVVTVTNVGTTDLVIGTLSVAGAGFALTADGLSGQTLAAGASASVTVSFNPSIAGAVTGSLSIPSNAPSTPNVLVLTGTGTSASDPEAWVAPVRDVHSGITYAPSSMPVGTYSGAQVNAAITSAGQGGDDTHRRSLTVAPGSTVTLTGTEGINLTGKTDFMLDLTGVAIALNTDGSSNTGSGLFIQGTDGVTVRGGTFTGQNTGTGTLNASALVDEQISAASIRAGVVNLELDSITWLKLRGFGPWLSTDGGAATAWPNGVWMHDCYVEGGEMGFAIVAGRNVVVERCTFVDSQWEAFDMEPDLPGHGYENILIQDCTIRRFGWEALYQGTVFSGTGGHTHWLLAANPGGSASLDPITGTQMDGLIFRNNYIPEGHVSGTPGPRGGQNIGGGGLLIRINKANPKQGTVITGNVSDQAKVNALPITKFNGMIGLTMTGNRQIMPGGVGLYTHEADATNVPDTGLVVTPNTTA